MLDEATGGGWFISLNVLKTVPTNELVVICTGEMTRQIEFSPPEITVGGQIQYTSEKFDMNNPGRKSFSL